MLSGALGFLPASIHAEPATTLSDPAFQQAVEKVVGQYLRSHPEVIEQSLRLLQAKRQAEEREQTRQIILTKQTELLHDPTSPVSGNLEGDVTVVEFFDYRCGYCKRVAGNVTQLQHDDPNVKDRVQRLPNPWRILGIGFSRCPGLENPGKAPGFS